ncbi:(2Fe-2S)-binding protein [Rhodopseudomonas palustris]|uniref:Bacterioferritin-associated ferredoxin n=1 Tax=Rhodopseudomonas palustris (strain BisB18) TaxID=316056 RepID=Q216I9_RHOPB
MIVCSCNVLSDNEIRGAILASEAPLTTGEVYGCLGCSRQCGRCARTIKKIMHEALTDVCSAVCTIEQCHDGHQHSHPEKHAHAHDHSHGHSHGHRHEHDHGHPHPHPHQPAPAHPHPAAHQHGEPYHHTHEHARAPAEAERELIVEAA